MEIAIFTIYFKEISIFPRDFGYFAALSMVNGISLRYSFTYLPSQSPLGFLGSTPKGQTTIGMGGSEGSFRVVGVQSFALKFTSSKRVQKIFYLNSLDPF